MFRSTALRNFLEKGGSYFSAFDSVSVIKVYSGTPPVNADALATGTLLATMSKAGGTSFPGDCLHFEDPVGGVLAKLAAETWKTLGASVVTGTPTYGRLVVQASDDGTLVTTTQKRIQFTIGSGAAEGNTGTGLCVNGTDYEYTFMTLTLPAGS